MAESILQGVTTSTPFLSCNRAQTPLFSVNPGVPAADALSVASCLLDEAVIALDCIEDRVPAGAACRLVEMAKAALDAAIDGEMEDKPSVTGDADRRLRDVVEYVAHLFRDGALIVNPNAGGAGAKDAWHFLERAARQVKGGAA